MRDLVTRITEEAAARTSFLRSVLVIAALLLAFGFIADNVMDGATMAFDSRIVHGLRNAADPANPMGPAWLQSMARDITALGSVAVLGLILAAVAGYLFLARKNRSAWLVLAAVIGGVLLNSALKYGFARPRPDFFIDSQKLSIASFPSGHSALSAISYLTLAALLAQTMPTSRIRYFFIAVGVFMTLIVGISRVYLGVHYPTDVLAGWCIGSAWALGCWALFTQLQREGAVEAPSENTPSRQDTI